MPDLVTEFFDWRSVPPNSLDIDNIDFGRHLRLVSKRTDIGLPRMRRMLETFVDQDFDEAATTASIADIHGNLEGLRRELTYIRSRGIQDLVCTGDLVDRDPHSVQVVYQLRDAKNYFDLKTTEGNHDLFFQRAMNGSLRNLKTWLGNGGLSMLSEEEVGLGHWPQKILQMAVEEGQSLRQWVREKFPEQVEMQQEIMRDIQENDCLNEINDWMINNMHLFYLNSLGVLYIHAGVECDSAGRNKLIYEDHHGIWALAKAEEDLFAALSTKATDHPVYDFLENPESPLWIRDWETQMEEDSSKCTRLLDSLGVTGIVVGHTVQSQTKGLNQGSLIFADRGLARAYQDQPAVIVAAPRLGMECVTTTRRFLSPKNLLHERAELARIKAKAILKTYPPEYPDDMTWGPDDFQN